MSYNEEELEFDWDDQKSILNFKKHGVRFSDAVTVWFDFNDTPSVRIISARKATKSEKDQYFLRRIL